LTRSRRDLGGNRQPKDGTCRLVGKLDFFDNGTSFLAPFETVVRARLALPSRGVLGCSGSLLLSSAEGATRESSVSDESDGVCKEFVVGGNGGFGGALSGL
jgi:hypothetical protein